MDRGTCGREPALPPARTTGNERMPGGELRDTIQRRENLTESQIDRKLDREDVK